MEIFTAQRGYEKKIQKLKPELARKIAAGEVIDRPHAIVRELLDNAIDSGATTIVLEIFSGGIEKIIVRDDGIGLSKEDLAICTEPHATSKIDSEFDLLKLQSMGFRGEALSSIAAVSRLKIQSKQAHSKENHGWLLESEVGLEDRIEACQIHKGTIVESQGIFANFPARRQFLKGSATEARLSRQVFIEKSLPFIDTNFTFISDGEQKLFFPKVRSYKERFAQALNIETKLGLLHELSAKDTAQKAEWQFKLVIADPSLARTDKKHIYIFVNNRKIDEYSFVQAIEYGCQGFFPNGLKPIAALFLEISPALVDFNIHPAKKEARFKDSKAIHRAIHTNIQAFFRSLSFKTMHKTNDKEQTFEQYELSKNFSQAQTFKPQEKQEKFRPLRDTIYKTNAFSIKTQNVETKDFEYTKADYDYHSNASFEENTDQEKRSFHFYGIFDSLFFLVEKDNALYIIDQHAAHERILFNEFIEKKVESQSLLFPFAIKNIDKKDDSYLESIQKALKEQGFDLEKTQEGSWELHSIHNLWEGNIEVLFDELLENNTKPQDLLRKIAQSYACKKAIKDGSFVDEQTAMQLIEKAFALDDPHCPHGRPIWTIISKEELFKRVKRL